MNKVVGNTTATPMLIPNVKDYPDERVGFLEMWALEGDPSLELEFLGETVIKPKGLFRFDEISIWFNSDCPGKICFSDGVKRSEWFEIPEFRTDYGAKYNKLKLKRNAEEPCTIAYGKVNGQDIVYTPDFPKEFMEAMENATELIVLYEWSSMHIAYIKYNATVEARVDQLQRSVIKRDEDVMAYADERIGDTTIVETFVEQVDYQYELDLSAEPKFVSEVVVYDDTDVSYEYREDATAYFYYVDEDEPIFLHGNDCHLARDVIVNPQPDKRVERIEISNGNCDYKIFEYTCVLAISSGVALISIPDT